jgi:hypothetical protein
LDSAGDCNNPYDYRPLNDLQYYRLLASTKEAWQNLRNIVKIENIYSSRLNPRPEKNDELQELLKTV